VYRDVSYTTTTRADKHFSQGGSAGPILSIKPAAETFMFAQRRCRYLPTLHGSHPMLRQDYQSDSSSVVEADRRYFTLAQANRALVLVRRIAADIVCQYAHLSDLQEALEAASEKECEVVRGGLLETIERLQSCLEELDDLGVELADWSRGIVNFPTLVDSRCVLLSWEPGQERIRYWYEAEEGLAGRQSIDTLPAAPPLTASSRP
jgi:hypothetical protein